MKTDVFANYKPTDTLSASGFMAGLPHGCGLGRGSVCSLFLNPII